MIAQVEDAIIALIKSAVTVPLLGYSVSSVESYGGEFDDDLANEIRRFPAIWVSYAGSGKPTRYNSSGTKWLVPSTFVTMVGARNIRGERNTRHGLTLGDGTVVEVGAYQMLEDVRLLLVNQDFGLEIDRFVPGVVRTLYNTKLNNQAFAIFAQEWHTKIVVEQPRVPLDPTDPDWLRLGISYFLKPGDDTADASDTITLAA